MRPLVNNKTEKSDLQFDEIQPSHQDLSPALRRDFDHFTARVALIDVELWAAAWLRAETNYENKIDPRYVERFKLHYAQQVSGIQGNSNTGFFQQFKAMKKWFGKKHYAQKRLCLVTVKNDEKNCKRTAIQSVVGTLDVHVRHPLHGELYPGENQKFDAVISLEVIEHVAESLDFCKSLGALAVPGGAVVISTINRTMRAYATTIVAAEYILNWESSQDISTKNISEGTLIYLGWRQNFLL